MSERHPLLPSDTPTYMQDAWASCIGWASQQPELIKRFAEETGYKPARSAIERAIDDATGHNSVMTNRFIEWCNKNVWGPMDGPDSNPKGGTSGQG